MRVVVVRLKHKNEIRVGANMYSCNTSVITIQKPNLHSQQERKSCELDRFYRFANSTRRFCAFILKQKGYIKLRSKQE